MLRIYHNPRCSKSREGLALLEASGQKFEVVEYLKEAPSEPELLELLKKLGGSFAEAVRTKEEKFLVAKFDLSSPEAVAKGLARHPELLERPIVVRGNKAVIGRPPEKIKSLL